MNPGPRQSPREKITSEKYPAKITSKESDIDSASVSTRRSIEQVAHWDHRGHSMIIVRLTYYSRNRVDKSGGPVQDPIHDILIESVTNNRRDDITGALIHDEKWFAQALEGPEKMVSATFERILRDPRHSDVRLIKMQPVPVRRFGAWWMACVARSDDNSDLFRHHCESQCFDPQLMRAERLGDLIEAVVARTPSHQGNAPWTTGSVTNAA